MIKFLGTYVSEDLKWPINTNAVDKTVQQGLHFATVFRRKGIKSVLAFSIAVVHRLVTGRGWRG